MLAETLTPASGSKFIRSRTSSLIFDFAFLFLRFVRNSQRHGSARYIYQYGGTFVGYFLQDERNGRGTFIWPDGDRFEGTWKDGGRVGAGETNTLPTCPIELRLLELRLMLIGTLYTKGGRNITQWWDERPHANYAEAMPRKVPEEIDSMNVS